DVHIVLAGKDDAVFEAGEKLAGELDAAGVRVFLDDRKATPGVKFADAELVGVPTIVIVGKGLKSGVIEVKDRATGERTEVRVDEAVRRLVELVKDWRVALRSPAERRCGAGRLTPRRPSRSVSGGAPLLAYTVQTVSRPPAHVSHSVGMRCAGPAEVSRCMRLVASTAQLACVSRLPRPAGCR